MSWLGVCHDMVILAASDPPESLYPMNYSGILNLFLQTLLVSGPGWPLSLREDEEDSNQCRDPHHKIFGISFAAIITRKLS